VVDLVYTVPLGGYYELAQGDFFGGRIFRCGRSGRGVACIGADLSELSLCRRHAVHRRVFHLQIDGTAVTLFRRIALSGSRYAGGGVTLSITNAGTTVEHAKRPVTACEQI
jgi:hypothetical protein